MYSGESELISLVLSIKPQNRKFRAIRLVSLKRSASLPRLDDKPGSPTLATGPMKVRSADGNI
jgi:hypothetical protein